MIGLPAPYDMTELNAKRQAVRNLIFLWLGKSSSRWG
nr:MAG TPA: hypothetical protein [Caudoviricetes sp.]